ncbi:MAG: DNA polymerase IV [Candidatus Micrarchaeota archaeon]|nr:DNA polymerase IV [Candidatus Micrarchaeota archaeon]
MDYFFAACEEARHPEFKGKPLIVGTKGSKDKLRGVVQTCNYEARAFGIHSAMPTAMAFKLKPDSGYAEADNDYYEQVSDRIMKAVKGFGFKTEVMSVDEAAVEVEVETYGAGESLARQIKNALAQEFSLPCTIGVSTGKSFAKMACDAAKPNGLKVLREEEIIPFIQKLPVGRLSGVGSKTEERLNAMGIKTVGELARTDPNVLIERFGSAGRWIHAIANGREMDKVVDNYDVLSIGRERTLEKESAKIEDIQTMVRKLVDEVMAQLNSQRLLFKTVTGKARYADFTEKLRSRSLTHYSDSADELYAVSLSLIKELVSEKPLRKVGVRVSGFMNVKGQKKL